MDVKQTVGSMSKQARVALLALVCAGVVSLAGCGDSPAAEANKKAAENSDAAGRLTASQGDYRAVQGLVDKVQAMPVSELPTAAAIKSEIGRITDGNYSKYIERRPAFDDLEKAAKLLADGLGNNAGDGPNAGLTATLQTQLATVSSQQAQLKLLELHDLLLDVKKRALDLQIVVNRINTYSALVQALDKHQTDASLKETLDKAKETLATATTNQTEKDAVLKGLRDEVASKKATAKANLDKAAADLLAADRAKGPESVTAYSNALELKGEAEKLLGEVNVLEAKVLAAESNAAVAKSQVDEANQVIELVQNAINLQDKKALNVSEQAKVYRENIQQLLDDKDTGLQTRLKAFKEQTFKCDSLVKQVSDRADKSAKQFQIAASKVENTEMKQLVSWFQAVETYQSGEAALEGWLIADIEDGVTNSVNGAYQSANLKVVPVVGSGTKKSGFFTQAQDKLHSADKILTPFAKYSDKTAVRWLGQSMRAVVNSRLYMLENKDSYKGIATEAARDALGLNPQLNIKDLL